MNFAPRFYLILAVICLLGSAEQWLNQESDTVWWRYAAAILVVGVLYEWIRARLVAVTYSLQQPVSLHLGRKEKVQVHLAHNLGRDIELQWTPEQIAGLRHLGGVYQHKVSFDTLCEMDFFARSLGKTHWHRAAAKVRGDLGLGWWPVVTHVDEAIIVVPETLASRQRNVGEISTGINALQQGQGFELHHLRDYVAGDPMRTLSWKATARQNRPITKVLQHEQHVELVIVLDIGRTSKTHIDGLSQFGHYVNLAARLAELAVLNGDAVGLLAVADSPVVAIAPRSNKQAVAHIRAALTGLQPLSVETNLLAAALRIQQMATRRSLIVLLTDMHAQDISSSFGQSLQTWRSRHLPMVVGLLGKEVALNDDEIEDVQEIYQRLAAQEYLKMVDNNAQGARLLGAEAIVTRPRELHDRVFDRYLRLKRQRRV